MNTELPEKSIEQLETPEYADGDFDLGVWGEEIEDMRADEIADLVRQNSPHRR